ncbi:MAG: hypothetical protein QOG23_2223 [Blastocatellia bacterium]|nr:hypothetical protein [Blastocatellia bacterium]
MPSSIFELGKKLKQGSAGYVQKCSARTGGCETTASVRGKATSLDIQNRQAVSFGQDWMRMLASRKSEDLDSQMIE